MREAIGTQTVFKTILIFTFLFSGFIAVAITYNKAYKIKNEVINILEKYEGVNSQSLTIINNYLDNSGYLSKNTCEDGHLLYKIKLFSRFNLPFVGDLFYFKITGETKGIKLYTENQKLK